jgi:exosortase A
MSGAVLSPTAAPPRLMQPALAFCAGVLLALAGYWGTAVSLTEIWRSTPTFAHCFFVLPAAALLAWRKRHELRGMDVRPEPLALPLIAGAGCLWVVGEASGVLLLQHIGLVATVILLVPAVFGRAIAKALWFPLVFLGFLVPVGDQLVPLLQDITTWLVVQALNSTGIPTLQDGILIQIPGSLFEVAEACAGVRFLIANIVVASLFAYLNFRIWWKAAAFMTLSAVIPIAANGLRGFGIILIAYWTDNEYAAGIDHIVYGWGFFAAVMLLSLYCGSLFADPPPISGGIDRGMGGRDLSAGTFRLFYAPLLAAALLAGPAVAHAVLSGGAWEAPSHSAPPRPAASWRMADGTTAGWRPVFAGAGSQVHQRYSNGQTSVRLHIAFYPKQVQGAEIIQHGNRLADPDRWTRVASGTSGLAIDGQRVPVRTQRLANSGEGRRLLIVYWYWVGGVFTADPIEAKVRQTIAALTGSGREAAVIAVAAELADAPGGGMEPIAGFVGSLPGLGDYLAGLARSGDAQPDS